LVWKLNKVLHLYKEYYPVNGGIQQAINSIVDLTPEYEHTVLTTSSTLHGEGVHGEAKVYYCKSYGTLMSTPLSPEFVFKAVSLAKKADIVIIHYPFPLSELAMVFSSQKNVIYCWHSDIVAQKRAKHLVYPFVRIMLRRAKHITISYPQMPDSSDILCEFREKTVLCPYTVEKDVDFENLDDKYPYRNFGRYTLSVGRLVPYKGFRYLLEALTKLDGINSVICGSGPLKQELTEQIELLGLQERVFMLEGLSDDELSCLYKHCEFYAFPSCMQSEAFGIAMLEALKHGKAVVNTHLGTGVNWVARDGKEAVTVEPHSADAFADGMRKLLTDTELRTGMEKSALERAQTVFSKEQRRETLKELFDKMI